MRLNERQAGASNRSGDPCNRSRNCTYQRLQQAQAFLASFLLWVRRHADEGAPWHAMVHLQVSPIWLCISLQGSQKEFWSRMVVCVRVLPHGGMQRRPVQRPSARDGSVQKWYKMVNRLVVEVVQH